MTKRYYIPLPRIILIPYRLISGICRLISSDWRKLSKRDQSVLRWLSQSDHPIRPQDRRVRNFRELEHAIKTGQLVTFSYLNSSKEESRRKILPKRLFRRKEAIYCQVLDSNHEEYRTFRLDRMGDLKIDLSDKGIR